MPGHFNVWKDTSKQAWRCGLTTATVWCRDERSWSSVWIVFGSASGVGGEGCACMRGLGLVFTNHMRTGVSSV